MPFTPAHPAYALPLRRLGLPTSGLVIGSMVPDVPLFVGGVVPGLPVAPAYAHTHSWWGLATTNLVVGLIGWVVWEFILRPALYDGLPRRVRERSGALAEGVRSGACLLWTVPSAVLLGAATHVGLDEFSHRGRWAATHVAWFRDTHAGLLGTSWVQYGAGALGLAILAVVLVRGWLRAEPIASPTLAPRWAAAVWAAPLVVAAIAVALSLAAAASGTPLPRLAFTLVTTAGAAMLVTSVGAALVWRVVVGSRPAE